MKVFQLHYHTAVKIEDLQVFPLNLEQIFGMYFMTV